MIHVIASQQPTPPPLILTLALDEEAHAFLEAERRRHFPPALNIVPAHLTLFHQLPGDREEQVRAFLAGLCAETTGFRIAVEGLRFLGRGVAYDIRSTDLQALRSRCARAFADDLIAQDRHAFRPHVTIQNKASPEAAKSLHAALRARFAPFEAGAVGLLLWRYLAGPWQRVAFLPFARRLGG